MSKSLRVHRLPTPPSKKKILKLTLKAQLSIDSVSRGEKYVVYLWGSLGRNHFGLSWVSELVQTFEEDSPSAAGDLCWTLSTGLDMGCRMGLF